MDFGIRAYLIRNRSQGTGILQQIFPDLNETNDNYFYLATSNPNYQIDSERDHMEVMLDVIDVMIRVLTAEGASALATYEEGLIPPPEGKDPGDFGG